MKKALVLTIAGLIVALPNISSAALYHYVDITGKVQDVQAATPAQALAIIDGNVFHSGVKLDEGLLQSGEFTGSTYNYVDVYGNLRTISAASIDAAFLLATDIAPNSGIVQVEMIK